MSFDAGASSDTDGDAITGYTFDFGDGTPAVTQAQSTVRHTYANSGRYSSFVTVKDARGAVSSNSDALTVTVGTPTVENSNVPPREDKKGPFGGALGADLLLGLGLLAALKRRRG